MVPQIDFSRSGEFQEFLNRLLNPEQFAQDNIIGVAIDFHPLWWRLFSFWHVTGGIDAPNPFAPWPPAPRVPHPDARWSSNDWQSICKAHGKRPYPFIVKICFRPGIDYESRSRLAGFGREWPFFCTTEERPLAVAAASFEGGRDIVANAPGTLGGFFADRNSTRVFGVTCSHVGQTAGTSVTLEDSTGVNHPNAGTVAYSTYTSLGPLAAGQACNRSVPGIATEIDVALIELDKKHTALKTVQSIGTIDAIFKAAQFGSGDAVEMRGAASKHNSFDVGAYDAVYKVLFKNGNLHCFEHMFEIHRQSIASGLVPPVLAAKAVQGDSGACICRPSPTGNFAYCGTLVAVDGTNGYACFAEAVHDWAAGLSPSIDLIPL